MIVSMSIHSSTGSMRLGAARALFGLAACIFTAGGIFHTLAYEASARAGIARSNLAGTLAADFKVLWLSNSTTVLSLALLFVFLAWRPFALSRSAIAIVSLIPIASSVLLYLVIGMFVPAHLLLIASGMVIGAALLKGADSA